MEFTSRLKKKKLQANYYVDYCCDNILREFFLWSTCICCNAKKKKYHDLVGIVKITLMGRTEICMYRLCLFFKKTVDILIRVRRENQ